MTLTSFSTRVRLKRIFIILLYTHFPPLTVHGCILLLNGWEPLSLAERTSLAPVVAAAFVRRTFRDLRTDIDTFTAEVSLLDIYKGDHLIKVRCFIITYLKTFEFIFRQHFMIVTSDFTPFLKAFFCSVSNLH